MKGMSRFLLIIILIIITLVIGALVTIWLSGQTGTQIVVPTAGAALVG